MKLLVVYRSCSGASMYYAEEIAQALGGEAVHYRRLPAPDGEKRLVIFCTGNHNGHPDGWSAMKARLESLGEVWLAVSQLSLPGEENSVAFAEKNKLHPENLWLLRGRMCVERLPVADRFRMRLWKQRLAHKKEKEKTAEDREILNALSFPTSFTEIHYIVPLVRKAREYMENNAQ